MSAPPQPLEEARRVAFGAAYRMLGVHADAEEVAQETLARLHEQSPPPRSPRSWCIAVGTRLSIDRLRSARARRESYVGEWLPEPLLEQADPAEEAELAESVSLALLIVLEALSPAERAAFLLHDVFGFSHAQLAATLGRSEPAVRQLVSRARRAVAARRVRFEPDAAERARVSGAFLRACVDGDLEALMEVLGEQVVMRADGGGVVPASRRPLEGRERVARALLALRRVSVGEDPEVELLPVNGTPGVLILEDGRPSSLMGVDVADGRVQAIHVIREPSKLAAALRRRR